MSYERFEGLVAEVCAGLHIPDVQNVLSRGFIEYLGFEVMFTHYESDPVALYLAMNFGVVPAGRTMRVFRLMLEANLAVYAQDQAQLGLDGESGSALLIVRMPMLNNVDGLFLIDTMDQYVEHGKYWKQTLMNSDDEMFAGICSGQYQWIRA